jgi:ribosomal-protein-alanine N-acetyltransferase
MAGHVTDERKSLKTREPARRRESMGTPSHWGRGIATAAARRMVELAEQSGDFARLQATVYQWNPASMRVLERAGFEREGVLRKSITKDGQLIDSVLFARVFGA